MGEALQGYLDFETVELENLTTIAANSSMYSLPGRDSKKEDIQRYLKARNRLTLSITRRGAFILLDGGYKINESEIEEAFNSEDQVSQNAALGVLKEMPKEKRSKVSLLALEKGTKETQVAILTEIDKYLSEEFIVEVILNKLNDRDEDVYIAALGKINLIPIQQRENFLFSALTNPSQKIQIAALKKVNFDLTQPVLSALFEKLEDSDNEVRAVALTQLMWLKFRKDNQGGKGIRDFIIEGIESEDENIILGALCNIHELEADFPINLICKKIRSGNKKIQKFIIEKLSSIPENVRLKLALEILKIDDEELSLFFLSRVKNNIPKNDLGEVFAEAIESNNEKTQMFTLLHLSILLENQRKNIILKALKKYSENVRLGALTQLWTLCEEEKNEVITGLSQGSQTDDLVLAFAKMWNLEIGHRVKVILSKINKENSALFLKALSHLSKYLPQDQYAELMQDYCQAFEDHNFSLYRSMDTIATTRKSFNKTGSGLTILGKGMTNKVVLRHVTTNSFSYWQKAYESVEFWKMQGFTYVPVEPIIDLNLDRDNSSQINVATGVLGMSLQEYLQICPKKQFKELLDQKLKIINGLSGLGINHGHAHPRNFCIRFERSVSDSNKIDFEKTPRLYIIDFDQARRGITKNEN